MMNEHMLKQQAYNAASLAGAGTAPSTAGATGLMRIADQLGEASARIENITQSLINVSIGIHGPRPEPVNEGIRGGNSPDSLASRISILMEAIDRLYRASESIVR